ncbi:Flavinator of succinate dehydrogenase-domain-containing protein [Haematococcus lacustris]
MLRCTFASSLLKGTAFLGVCTSRMGWASTLQGASGMCTAGQRPEDSLEAISSRLLYRSKQRGFLELDLLVGLWAEKEIPAMNLPMLQDLAVMLDQENPDLFKWLTGQLPPSELMASNMAFKALRKHVAQQLGSNSQQKSHASQGVEWVRGWDDAWRKKAVVGQPEGAS